MTDDIDLENAHAQIERLIERQAELREECDSLRERAEDLEEKERIALKDRAAWSELLHRSSERVKELERERGNALDTAKELAAGLLQFRTAGERMAEALEEIQKRTAGWEVDGQTYEPAKTRFGLASEIARNALVAWKEVVG